MKDGRRTILAVVMVLGGIAALVVYGSVPGDLLNAGESAAAISSERGRARAPWKSPEWVTPVFGWVGGVTRDADGLVAISGNTRVMALDPSTGEVKWETPVPPSLMNVPPAAGDGVIALTATDGFFVFDRNSGSPLWESRTTESTSTVQVGGGVVVTATYEGRLTAHEARTGVKRWEVAMPGGIGAVPAIDPVSGTVVAVWQGGAPADGRMVALDLATGVKRWGVQIFNGASAPVIDGGIVIVGDGDRRIHAFSVADGAERWSLETDGAFESHIDPVTGDGKLVIVDRVGTVSLIQAATGELLWRTPLDDAVIAPRPVLTPRHVVVTTFGTRRLVVLDRRSGKVVHDLRPEGLIHAIAWSGDLELLHVGFRLTDPGRIESWRL